MATSIQMKINARNKVRISFCIFLNIHNTKKYFKKSLVYMSMRSVFYVTNICTMRRLLLASFKV